MITWPKKGPSNLEALGRGVGKGVPCRFLLWVFIWPCELVHRAYSCSIGYSKDETMVLLMNNTYNYRGAPNIIFMIN